MIDVAGSQCITRNVRLSNSTVNQKSAIMLHEFGCAAMYDERMTYIDWIKREFDRTGKKQIALARYLGLTHPQVTRLLQGTRRLKADEIERIATFFGTTAPRFEKKRTIPVVGYVGAGAEIVAIDDHAKGAGLDEIECPWDELAASTVAVRVRGDSMVPAYYDGDIIFYDDQHTDILHLLGKDCVVALTDGRRYVKQLRRTADGIWYLHSHNMDPILGVQIEWASKVRLIWRAD